MLIETTDTPAGQRCTATFRKKELAAGKDHAVDKASKFAEANLKANRLLLRIAENSDEKLVIVFKDSEQPLGTFGMIADDEGTWAQTPATLLNDWGFN